MSEIFWTAVAALAAVVAALAAVATAVIVFFQVKQEGRLNRLTMGVDALLRLSDDWKSPRMIRTRRRAAKALLDGKPNSDVDDILDWFETVALLVRRGGFDLEFTWHTFYVWMANYWTATRDYIRDTQKDEGGVTWLDYSELMPRLFTMEGTDAYPTLTEVQDFLEDEASLTEAPEPKPGRR